MHAPFFVKWVVVRGYEALVAWITFQAMERLTISMLLSAVFTLASWSVDAASTYLVWVVAWYFLILPAVAYGTVLIAMGLVSVSMFVTTTFSEWKKEINGEKKL